MNAKAILSSAIGRSRPATGQAPIRYLRATRISFRSAVTRHDPNTPDHTYYDGGDLTPYCVDSLVDLLRAEARLPYSSLNVELELTGTTTAATLREVGMRFSELAIRGLRVRIRADGQPPLLIATRAR
jgi:hypothetical protein